MFGSLSTNSTRNSLFGQESSSSSMQSRSRPNISKQEFREKRLTGKYRHINPTTGKIKEQGNFQNGQEYDQDGDQIHYQYQQQKVGALCNDGTTSSSIGKGACSWHGGVAQWLYSNVKTQVKVTGKYRPIEERIADLKTQIKSRINSNRAGLELQEVILKYTLELAEENDLFRDELSQQDTLLQQKEVEKQEVIKKKQVEIDELKHKNEMNQLQKATLRTKITELQTKLKTLPSSKQQPLNNKEQRKQDLQLDKTVKKDDKVNFKSSVAHQAKAELQTSHKAQKILKNHERQLSQEWESQSESEDSQYQPENTQLLEESSPVKLRSQNNLKSVTKQGDQLRNKGAYHEQSQEESELSQWSDEQQAQEPIISKQRSNSHNKSQSSFNDPSGEESNESSILMRELLAKLRLN